MTNPAALRPLGQTGIQVSAVSFGCWGLAEGWGAVPRTEDPDRVLDIAWEHGVVHFDTAAVYGRGRGEDMLGSKAWRNDAVLATKLSARTKPTPPVSSANSYYSQCYIDEQINASLARMRRSYVDIYYLHNWFPHWHAEEQEIFGMLSRLKKQGKVRAIGVALPYWYNRPIDSLLTTRLIDVVQTPINLFQHWATQDIVPVAMENGIGVVARSPLDHGGLSIRIDRMAELHGGDGRHDVFTPDRVQQLREQAHRICGTVGISMSSLANYAIAGVLSVPGVSTALVGMTTQGQVLENMDAANYYFSDSHLAAADRFAWKRTW